MRIFLDGNSDQVKQQVEKVEKLVMDGESLIAGDNLVHALKVLRPIQKLVGWRTQLVDGLIIENPQLLIQGDEDGEVRVKVEKAREQLAAIQVHQCLAFVLFVNFKLAVLLF